MQRGSSGLAAIVIGALAFAVAPSAVNADPNGSTVTGVIELPPRATRKPRPVSVRGFTKRIRGPLKEPQKRDPRTELVVFLDGGPVTPADAKPGKDPVRYMLVGESFATRVFPFIVGTPVEVKNASKDLSPRLHAPGAEGAIESAPVSPGGNRPVEAPKEPFKTLEIRDHDSAHLSGVLLSLPHAYFATVDADGKYEIKGVPAGKWTIKVWHGKGWVKLPKSASVTVVAKRPAKAGRIVLPATLETAESAGGK